MHAFDLDNLSGGITVRAAQKGETLALLDDSNIELDDTCLVIADGSGPIALAGVMGGRASAVATSTTRVLLESAYFERTAVARTARRFGLLTDAAHRFERGVDPEGQTHAVEFATRLIVELCGGRAGPTMDVRAAPLPPRRIRFRPAHAGAVLGLAVDEAGAREIFTRLNCVVHDEQPADQWQVEPPSYRFDLCREVDLIEEIARLRGYDRLPETHPRIPAALDSRRTRPNPNSVFRRYLVTQGYFEAITYSFIPHSLWTLFAAPEDEPLGLLNPISQDMAVMRASLWPGLVLAAQRNLNRQAGAAKLFESGMVFAKRNGHVSQTVRFAGLAIGPASPEQWGVSSREVDFFDVKQDVENMLGAFGLRGLRFGAATIDGLHPGQAAAIFTGKERIGWLGALHPRIRNSLELIGNPILFEIDTEALPEPARASFSPLSRYPQVRRDLNIVVPEQVSAEAVMEVARGADNGLLKDLQLFDVYRGQGIDSDKKSMALGLIFQASSSTLTDEQVEAAVENIRDRLGRELGGVLRT